jgi:hypothetical protein
VINLRELVLALNELYRSIEVILEEGGVWREREWSTRKH